MAKDPRLGGADDVNTALQERTIRHMVYLERYKASEVKRMKRIIDREVIPDLTEKIAARLEKIADRGYDTGVLTTKRLKALQVELKAISDKMAEKLSKQLSLDLDQLASQEVVWQVGAINEEVGANIKMRVPPAETLVLLAQKQPFAGFTLDEWFNTLSEANQRNITRTIQQSVVEGETVSQTMRRIRGTKALGYKDGIMEVTRRQAEAITRSSVNHVTNQARNKLFEANSDIIRALQWTATLDSRTTFICASRDGQVTPVGKNSLPPGARALKPADARPPAHVNCRSTMTPILIGDNLPEGTRASVNGQVPANTTYGEWLRKQPKSVQVDALGKSRAELFRKGELEVDRFIGADLKPLTLEQLRVKEKSAFEKADIDL